MTGSLTLTALADVACYTPSHLVWTFRRLVGMPPMEYVRRRRLTEAARRILAGEDIVTVGHEYGFSAQDVFTRSFRNALGVPPGRFRVTRGRGGSTTPAFVIHNEGEKRMLGFNLDCDPIDTIVRVQQLLTDEALQTIEQIARAGELGVQFVGPTLCEDLCTARVVSREGSTLRLATAVFLESDIARIAEVAAPWGSELASRVTDATAGAQNHEPDLRRYVVGMIGIDQGVFDSLIRKGYAFDHRSTSGRFRGAKIDFYEDCDAYDAFGPYLSGGYGVPGRRYSLRIIGVDGGIHRWLQYGIEPGDRDHMGFRQAGNRVLVDALGDVLTGASSDPDAVELAERARLMVNGTPTVARVATDDAAQIQQTIHAVRQAVDGFLDDAIQEMNEFLVATEIGSQGVPVSQLIVDLMRYVRMVTHKELYGHGLYTDSLPDGGAITILKDSEVELVPRSSDIALF